MRGGEGEGGGAETATYLSPVVSLSCETILYKVIRSAPYPPYLSYLS